MDSVKVAINRLLGWAGYQAVRIDSRHGDKVESNVKQEPVTVVFPDAKDAKKVQLSSFRTRFSRYSTNHDFIKLHFGCGPRVLKGWINIDLDFEPYEKYMASYTDVYYPASMRGTQRDFYKFNVTIAPLPIPDNSVDVIFHEDFLEHISQRDQVAFLAETLRVLKKGGVHRVNTPDLISSMKTNARFKKGFIGTYFGEWDNHQHISVLSKAMLKEMALIVGYSRVIFNGKNKSTSPDMPLEYRPNPKSRSSGNIHVDLVK